MNWKPIAREAMVGGLAGLAVVVLFLLLSGKADAGDWLQFSGSIIGVCGAVFGALYVEKRRRAFDREDEIRMVKRTLEALKYELDLMLPSSRDKLDYRGALIRIVAIPGLIEDARNVIEGVHRNIRLTNHRLYNLLSIALNGLNIAEGSLKQVREVAIRQDKETSPFKALTPDAESHLSLVTLSVGATLESFDEVVKAGNTH